MRRLRPFAVVSLLFFAGAGLAFAQGGYGNVGPSAAASASASASASNARPARPMGGYSYSDPKPAKNKEGQAPAQPAPPPRPRAPVLPKAAGPVATLPGFETLGDGTTRVFVQLSQSVPVEERKTKTELTYVLKGARVTVHNNTNPLVTVHFNTPVTQARLRPAGADLFLVIDLRATVSPAWKMTAAKDGTAILQIDFPKGDYLPRAAKDEAKDKS